jgi:hypothetical protein
MPNETTSRRTVFLAEQAGHHKQTRHALSVALVARMHERGQRNAGSAARVSRSQEKNRSPHVTGSFVRFAP